MKKTYLFILAFFTFTVIAIISCSQLNADIEKESKTKETSETRTAGVTYTVDDASYNFNLSITFNNDGTNSLTASERTTIETYLNSRFSSLNFSSVSNTDALFYYDANDFNKEQLTLIGFGLDSQGNDNPIAFVFNGDGDGTGGSLSFGGNAGTEHSCIGAPCDCCGFLYEDIDGGILGGKYQKIVGCTCKTTPAACFQTTGRCDHSITSKS